MSAQKWDACILGAGPAGMGAAIGAASCGVSVLVLDEHPLPGGQVYRGLEGKFGSKNLEPDVYEQGKTLLNRFRKSSAVFCGNQTVWFAGPGCLVSGGHGQSQRIATKKLVICNGAQERPVPFKGWTLPGVMGAGAADILWRTADTLPQAPTVLMGNGPLMLQIAHTLLANNDELTAIIDTGDLFSRIAACATMPAAILDLPYLGKGIRMALAILKKRPQIIRQPAQIQAFGSNSLERITYRVSGKEKTMQVNTLLVHENLVPRTHTSRLLRVEHLWNKGQRYWYPACDADGTSLSDPDIFFAGDGQFVYGAEISALKGELAGIAVAASLGAINTEEAKERSASIHSQMRRLVFARHFLQTLFRPNRYLWNIPDDTVVCRCEQITAGQIREAASEGCVDINDIKTRTRSGMGQCQGRMCLQAIAEIAAQTLCRDVEDVGTPSIRPPLRPIALAEYCHFKSDA